MRLEYSINRTRTQWAFAVNALLMTCMTALCGPTPPPLEVQLDLANHVVIGHIVELDKEFNSHGSLQTATATIAVSRTLKGPVQKTVKAIVVIGTGSTGWGGSRTYHPRKKGDSGIWILGNASGTFGLLPESKLQQVEQTLDFLSNRKWTDSEDGLVAWAGVLYLQYGRLRQPWITMAIRNVSDHEIYYPMNACSVTIFGQSWETLRTESTQANQEPVFCRKILPGSTVYIDDFSPALGHIDAPPGRYTVSLVYGNAQNGITATGPCDVWKGKLAPMPFGIIRFVDENNAPSRSPHPAAISYNPDNGLTNQAVIRVTEIHRYPQDYDVPGSRTTPTVFQEGDSN